MFRFLFSPLLLFLSSCSSQTHDCYREDYQWQVIPGQPTRVCQESIPPQPLYHAKVPAEWLATPSVWENNLSDTTKPLCTFSILDKNDVIHIYVHHFPRFSSEETIPPEAQIARWQNQYRSPIQETFSPWIQGGFRGLFFAAETEERAVLAWAMQCAHEHMPMLTSPRTREEQILYPQMAADYTIKVVGPPSLVQEHEAEIFTFVKSFSLIDAIPSFC